MNKNEDRSGTFAELEKVKKKSISGQPSITRWDLENKNGNVISSNDDTPIIKFPPSHQETGI